LPGILDLPTPCLVLDLDRFEANLDRMARVAAENGVALRPHAKTHKCPAIARAQLARGAAGVCVATIAEAEVMARAGIRGLLLTAAVVGEPKVSRFIEVVRAAPDTKVVVDDARNVRELQRAAAGADLTVGVLLDLDVGQGRTGVQPGPQARSLAREIAGSRNLSLQGICAYAGHVAHVNGFAERRAAAARAMERALATRALLQQDGHEIAILTGASTGTYNIDPELGVTELQPGSYVFMDVEYRQAGGKAGALYDDFSPALTVLATVVHRSAGRAVVDAGLKAFAAVRGCDPEVLDVSGCRYEFAGDEHGLLRLSEPSREIELGEKLRFIVPHCDPTVNLYDRIWCSRGGEVRGFWSVMERAAAGPYF
jgi:D-serine deaminase-like pyridoxal phosphate-dependent protein